MMKTATYLRSSLRFIVPQIRSDGSSRNAWIGVAALTGMIILSNFFADFAANSPAYLLLLAAFYVYLTIFLSGNRRSYRALGMNRSRAVIQQLWVSLPLSLLLLGTALLLLDVAATWSVAVSLLLLLADLGATARAVSDGRDGGQSIRACLISRPGDLGSLERRLVWAPMLRWSLPVGLLTGLVLTWAGHAGPQLMATVTLVAGVILTYLLPTVAYTNATASAGTWQAFGLPRRAWARASTVAAVVMPVLTWTVVLVVPAVLAAAGLIDAAVFSRLLAPVLGLAALLTGLNAASVAEAGFNGGYARTFLFSMTASAIIIGHSVDGWDLAPILAAVFGLLLLIAGIWTQVHFAQGKRGGGRATLDTRKFAD